MAQWIITKDNISEGLYTAVGTKSYSGMKGLKLTEKFRLKDDDGEIYFYGKSSDSNSERAFEPLDDFGETFGCTSIEYYNKEAKTWEIL